MIVDFFRKGRGQSKGPLDYFLGKDRKREHAKILSGDEREIADLIDSSPYTKKYTSGCLSFYEDDLTPEVKAKLMKDFEQCLFPGMGESQYRVLWIEHRDKDNLETGKKRLELNFLIPNVELGTGDRLQPFFYKADQSRVDLFKKVVNFQHQLHDPDDPEFRQATTTQKNLPKLIKDIRAVIDIEAQKAVEAGLITDRASMVQWLIDLGLEVENQKNKSISIKNPHSTSENSRNIKLTGTIYEQNFRVTAASADLTKQASDRYRREARKRYEGDLQRYHAHLDYKSRELEEKYRHGEARYIDPSQHSDGRSLDADGHLSQGTQESPSHSHQGADTATVGADPSPTSALASIEPLEPRNSESSQHKKNPYYFDYSLSFSDSYFAYHNHLFRVREQKQMGRDPSPRSEVTAGRSHPSAEDRSIQTSHDQPLQRPESPEWEKIANEYDLTSTSISRYRRTTAAAQAATASARRSLESYTGASWDYRAVKELHSDFKHQAQRGGPSSGQISGDCAEVRRADNLTAFFADSTGQLGYAVTRTLQDLSKWLENRDRSASDTADLGTTGNREANKATSATNLGKTHLSTAVSREVRSFDRGGIFKALGELDRRKVAKKNLDNDYDSPMPF